MTLEEVFKAAINYPEVAFPLKNTLASDLVTEWKPYHLIANFLAEFIDEYGKLPKEKDWKNWRENLPEEQKRGVVMAFSEIEKAEISGYTKEYIRDHASNVLRSVATQNAVSRLGEITNPNVGDLERILEEVRATEPASLEGLADLKDVDHWARREKPEDSISTGIPSLDGLIGGWRDGELAFLLADSGVGKSASLINFGYTAALHGASVFHVTLELSQRNSVQRFYRRVAGADRSAYFENIEDVREKAKDWWRFARGEYRLIYRTPHSITPEKLEQIINLHEQQYGDIDVLLLDYLDLMAPSPNDRNLNSYEQLGRISHRVRGYAQEHNFTAISATQATRPSGAKQTHDNLSLSKMGDSYQKVRAADIIIGLVRSEEEQEAHQGRYQILKMRENPNRGDIPLFIYLDQMYIGDLDHWETKKIMEDADIYERTPVWSEDNGTPETG